MRDSTSKCCKASLASVLLLSVLAAAAADDASRPPVELKVRPRVCTLAGDAATCNTTVHAEWRSPRNESLCLLIVDRPEVRRCWEDHQQGVYSVEVSFTEDLVVELRDPELDRVLASQAIAVIRQALLLRHKRRPPWNIF
ncbi:MAG TPA: DUF3019 domain-containing protein [Steroidobacteraceae bacterium]|nr:DUF3019 domain-containing protein [Steroidobacteraceae bacterium]